MNQTDSIDINRLLDRYAISLVPGDMVKLTADKKTAAMICPIIKANKPAIVAELKRREAERKAIKARRDAAYSELREGIMAIRNAQNALRNDRDYFARCMEQGVSKFKASEPVDLDAIKAQFPAAAAYCKADDMSMKSNYIYAGAGKRAKERMLDGMDWKQALDLMEQETKTDLD